MPSLLVKYFSTETSQSVAVEDDGRVAYAYLIGADDRICGDVWLYNRCVAPEEPEWCSMDNAPFANPASYVADCEAFRPANSGADFSAEWVREDGGLVAKLFLRGELLAVLKEGANPVGASREERWTFGEDVGECIPIKLPNATRRAGLDCDSKGQWPPVKRLDPALGLPVFSAEGDTRMTGVIAETPGIRRTFRQSQSNVERFRVRANPGAALPPTRC